MEFLLYPPQLDPKSELQIISLHYHSLTGTTIEHKVWGFISCLPLPFAKVRNYIELRHVTSPHHATRLDIIVFCFVASTTAGSEIRLHDILAPNLPGYFLSRLPSSFTKVCVQIIPGCRPSSFPISPLIRLHPSNLHKKQAKHLLRTCVLHLSPSIVIC